MRIRCGIFHICDHLRWMTANWNYCMQPCSAETYNWRQCRFGRMPCWGHCRVICSKTIYCSTMCSSTTMQLNLSTTTFSERMPNYVSSPNSEIVWDIWTKIYFEITLHWPKSVWAGIASRPSTNKAFKPMLSFRSWSLIQMKWNFYRRSCCMVWYSWKHSLWNRICRRPLTRNFSNQTQESKRFPCRQTDWHAFPPVCSAIIVG